jgi:hypothetical protein
MSIKEVQPKPAERNEPKSDSSPNNALHQTVFNSPDEYLNILKNNFSTLSRGNARLGLPDLTLDANDSSLSPDLRQAAGIAAKNFDQLIDMSQQQEQGPTATLKQSDLGYIDNMVNGKILGPTAKLVGADLTMAGLTGAMGWGGAGMASVPFEGGIATTIADGAVDVVALGAIGAGIAVVSLAATGYLAYRAASEYKRAKGESSDDARQISQWIK